MGLHELLVGFYVKSALHCARALPRVHFVYGGVVVVSENSGSYIDCLIVNL